METSLPIIAQYQSGIKSFIQLQDNKMVNSESRVSTDFQIIRLVLIILILGSLATGMLIAWRITLSITHPLQRAVTVARKVAEGDLTRSMEDISARDETGLLLQALDEMNINLHRIVQRVRDGAETIAAATAQIASGNQGSFFPNGGTGWFHRADRRLAGTIDLDYQKYRGEHR
ncbi:methyl-accepting chemotaxis protein [Acerihabitans sp. KWT182]|uniref:Methyl-accepting chemotaxis protein n=1 Tax=Acerihabitans sp. KWT182 TaxID=3157919 RepID=A0AAU7Q916_9GAMM